MDLNREKRDGLSAEGIGRPKSVRKSPPGDGAATNFMVWSWFIIAALAIVGTIWWIPRMKAAPVEVAAVAERISARYQTMRQAIQAGGLKEGWLPGFVPFVDSFDLQVEREGFGRWMRCKLVGAGARAFPTYADRVYQAVPPEARDAIVREVPAIDWWPPALRTGGAALPGKWKVYWTGKRFRGGEEYLAITPAGHVFVWLGPPPNTPTK